MIHQYYLGKVNLNKLPDLTNYLVLSKNFKASKRNVRDPFIYQFDLNKWENKNGFDIFVYNEKHNLFIETNNGKEESFENLKLIQNIMEIVEAKDIFSGAGVSLEKILQEKLNLR